MPCGQREQDPDRWDLLPFYSGTCCHTDLLSCSICSSDLSTLLPVKKECAVPRVAQCHRDSRQSIAASKNIWSPRSQLSHFRYRRSAIDRIQPVQRSRWDSENQVAV